ncbi:MAG: hypothetical protein JSV62_03055 [Promethearchaeota archaeon]|nr:MAG: hypothetical protein JSV62_03055 [Candidatus Lokiarchaeota archaeon]
METMSFGLGIDDYEYYDNPIRRNNGKCKDIASSEIYYSKNCIEGEKDR